MHTYLLSVGVTGNNTSETAEKVEMVVKESLESDFENNTDNLREVLEKDLVNIFGSDNLTRVLVEEMYRMSTPDKKSFSIFIMAREKRNMIISAMYKELNTLRDLAALVVARRFHDDKEVDKLEDVPRCLLDCIKQFL